MKVLTIFAYYGIDILAIQLQCVPLDLLISSEILVVSGLILITVLSNHGRCMFPIAKDQAVLSNYECHYLWKVIAKLYGITTYYKVMV